MNKLYQRNEIMFAILWIVLYVVGLSVADNLSVMLGMEKSIKLVVCIVMTSILVIWMKKQDLSQKYGLCKSVIPAKRLLCYIPLCFMASINLWFGVAWNLSAAETFLYMLSMLFVGFLEEVIFRGLLFKAMYKDGPRSAIIVSSVTFGIGHIVNLINGSGAELFSNVLQVLYAIAGGFLFTMLFMKSKSLWACIICHGILNALSVFANKSAMTPMKEVISAVILIVISVSYAIYIHKLDIVE